MPKTKTSDDPMAAFEVGFADGAVRSSALSLAIRKRLMKLAPEVNPASPDLWSFIGMIAGIGSGHECGHELEALVVGPPGRLVIDAAGGVDAEMVDRALVAFPSINSTVIIGSNAGSAGMIKMLRERGIKVAFVEHPDEVSIDTDASTLCRSPWRTVALRYTPEEDGEKLSVCPRFRVPPVGVSWSTVEGPDPWWALPGVVELRRALSRGDSESLCESCHECLTRPGQHVEPEPVSGPRGEEKKELGGMKLCMVTDQKGWCFERTARALVKYHNTRHTWSWAQAVGDDGRELNHLEEAALYRVGGLYLVPWLLSRGLPSKSPGQTLVATVASFADLGDPLAAIERGLLPSIAAFLVNDLRQEEGVIHLGLPIIYSPDRADQEVFFPKLDLRPPSGPLRVGWAGSEFYWPGVKHVDLIAEACERVKGVKFVRQDREKEGLKGPAEMCSWINSLDVYVAANEERSCTPVTQLEAVACGVPVLTTRCGELWRVVESFEPGWIIERPTAKDIAVALELVVSTGRKRLRDKGLDFWVRYAKHWVTWECGEAERVTRVFERLALASAKGGSQ